MRPTLPVSLPPARTGTTSPVSRPIRRLKNRNGVSPLPAARPALARPANANVPAPSRKKSRFSGKNRLKRVRFTCCSSTSTCAKSVFTVRSAVRFWVSPYLMSPPTRPSASLGDRRPHGRVGGDAPEDVGLQLDDAGALGRLQPGERPGRGHLEDAAKGGQCAGDVGQVRPLVLPAHHAAQVHAPRLIAARVVAQRLERDGHLDGPAALEVCGLHAPDGVPVGVGWPLVGHLAVGEPADGIGVEEVAVPPIVEGVEQHEERVVLPELAGVATHFVGDSPFGVRLVGSGPTRRCSGRRRRSRPRSSQWPARFEGLLLDESTDERRHRIGRLVEQTVDGQGRRDAHRSHRGRAARRSASGLCRWRHRLRVGLCLNRSGATQAREGHQ